MKERIQKVLAIHDKVVSNGATSIEARPKWTSCDN